MFYTILLFLHSVTRWLVLITLILSVVRASVGLVKNETFSKSDDSLRNGTMSISHMQLTIGILLYGVSPLIRYFWSNIKLAKTENDPIFFGLIHMTLMVTAVVFITVGSGLAKRRTGDREKFKTMLVWFSAALLIILIAIPWPFSPLAFRPFIRLF